MLCFKLKNSFTHVSWASWKTLESWNKWPCFEPKESRWVYLEIDFECEGFEIQEASTFI